MDLLENRMADFGCRADPSGEWSPIRPDLRYLLASYDQITSIPRPECRSASAGPQLPHRRPIQRAMQSFSAVPPGDDIGVERYPPPVSATLRGGTLMTRKHMVCSGETIGFSARQSGGTENVTQLQVIEDGIGNNPGLKIGKP